MESRSLQVLEFGKVLTHLAGLCVSEAGAEAALAVRPLTGIDAVRHAAALFDEARRWAGHTGFRLSSFPPLDGVFRALDAPATVLDLDALWALRQTLGLARKLAVSIREGQSTGGRWDLLTALVDSHPLPQRTVSGLDRCVSDDGMLRDESSPELSLVRGEIRRIHQQCTRKVKEYAQRYNIGHYLQDEFMTLSSDRYVLPLKSNFKGRLQGIIHDYSQTGETCYFEPMFLVELNNGLQELKREEREEERKVLRYLTDLVRDELAAVRGAYDLLVEGDVLCARCVLSARFEETGDSGTVAVSEGGHVSLLGARHPLLALAAARGEKGGASAAHAAQSAPSASRGKSATGQVTQHGPQAVDIELLPGQLGLVISGGNAGGKTVCLKTLGLIALMGLAGLPVPVRPGSSLPFWTDIFAFIGDEQSLEDNVSTFTAQIRHLSGVWDRLGPGALVILDEFGAGTDPAQGAALAQAVLDEVMEAGSAVVAATHFPALKAYALTRDKVRAASVLFDPATKRPLFRLAYDQVGASQALDVAREHGLPEAVLRRAEQYLLLDGEDTSALVDRLNTLAVQREAEISSLRAEEVRLRDKRAKLDERFERERRTLFETVQGQAKTVLQEWKSGKVSHKQALKALAETRARLVSGAAGNGDADGMPGADDAPQAPALQVETLRTGQAVRYVPWGKKGTVVEVDARRGRVRVDLSGVTMWAEAKDLAALDEKPRVVVGAVTRTISDATASMRVDLRGMRADVAVSELSRALDKALLAGMSAVEAIHGRGTGALRKEIHAFLKSFPAVRSFALAPEDQGGDGMTIIELK
ncbi:endonuclease MutS2 [Nitratidesulfovibrio termitidis]|uniref:endonuclease MutS2 n=1 Tax=Nitratidesulfovibrio termitidis TaxID=42252 RepID=UPI0004067CAC|nr:Smr/MutS family protein [Nitratidesulfovibrio termitidis]